ncbi:hypothetical protein [Methanorbis rubei]
MNANTVNQKSLKDLRNGQKPVTTPNNVRISTRIPEKTAEQLVSVADAEGISPSAKARDILVKYFGDNHD